MSSISGRLRLDSDNLKSSREGNIENQTHNPLLPVIDCQLSSWSPWSTCSARCGNAKRTRSRYIVQMPQNGGKPCDKKLSRTQRCKGLPSCPQSNKNWPTGSRNQNSAHNRSWFTTTTSGSILDDEDDTDDKYKREEKPCQYGNWSQWSECEIVCQPVKKGSNKVRLKHPTDIQGGRCQVIEEFYYCDPNIYC